MKKILDYLTAKPARFFLLAALIWGGLMCYLNYKDGANFAWHDLLVEANGMVFDLLVFGILLSIYEALREKKEKIERLHEEIDDYRGWDEKEAMYRIIGAVKRLKNAGVEVSKINLSCCFLEEADLRFVKFERANLVKTNLMGAILMGANLMKTNLMGANLKRANLMGANLIEANLAGANLSKTDLREADLRKADLSMASMTGADLRGADLGLADLSGADFSIAKSEGLLSWQPGTETNLTRANLQGAIVNEGWFNKLGDWNVLGKEEIVEKYLIDKNGRLQLK